MFFSCFQHYKYTNIIRISKTFITYFYFFLLCCKTFPYICFIKSNRNAMIFKDDKDIIEIIKRNLNIPEWVLLARNYHKEMKALMYGDDFKNLLLRIEHIEADEKRANARRKYSRPIKDVVAKILRPVDYVYSATGGSKIFNIKEEKQKTNFLKEISAIKGGLSVQGWLEKFWSKDLYNADPNGLIMLEFGKDKPPYPTYKSINVIRNYYSDGQRVEWVLFEPKQAKTQSGDNVMLWRLVSSDKDYQVIQRGEIFDIDKNNTFDMPFGDCPALVCSDKERLGKCNRVSMIDDVKEVFNEHLRDRSIKTNHKFLNGFSIPYRPKVICPECHGTGKNGIDNCSSCNGKGLLLEKDVTSEIIIPIDLTSDSAVKLPNNFAGYISPDIKIWDKYDEELKSLSYSEFETIWGTRESETKDQTAMGIILNTQPMTARLDAISRIAEFMEWQLIEWVANYHLPLKDKKERISSITYGRNYIIQPPNVILENYENAKQSGDSDVILDRLFNEYLTAKFGNDPATLRLELKKKDLEPFTHLTIKEVSEIYGARQAQRKGLYSQWLSYQNSIDLISKPIETLENERDIWIENQINKLMLI